MTVNEKRRSSNSGVTANLCPLGSLRCALGTFSRKIPRKRVVAVQVQSLPRNHRGQVLGGKVQHVIHPPPGLCH